MEQKIINFEKYIKRICNIDPNSQGAKQTTSLDKLTGLVNRLSLKIRKGKK
jgi:hypothetical protein